MIFSGVGFFLPPGAATNKWRWITPEGTVQERIVLISLLLSHSSQYCRYRTLRNCLHAYLENPSLSFSADLGYLGDKLFHGCFCALTIGATGT